MQLHEIPLEDFKPGIKFITFTGKLATVVNVKEEYPEYCEHYGGSTNRATLDGDDHWFLVDIEGDDWDGHGMYYSHIPTGLEVISQPKE